MPLSKSSKRPRSTESGEEEDYSGCPVGKVGQASRWTSGLMLTSSCSETMLATSPHITYLVAS